MTDSDDDRTFFDRFAGRASDIASRAPFFMFCLLLVVVWAPSILVLRDIDTWQLIINTATTIITFLMVALLQNSEARSDKALHAKLDRVLEALEELPDTTSDRLAGVVGLEHRTGTKKGT